MSATVEIYTRPGCGYCSAAKSLLVRKSVTFIEFDVATDSKFREQMLARSNGGTTFPQIFIDKNHIGGCDELYALDREGKLDNLLAGQNTDLQKVSS
jgi:glutaredoxin 3